MEILRKNQKEMLQIKNTVTKIYSSSDRLINRLDIAEERNSELEDTPIKTS